MSYKELELAHAYRISGASHMLVHPSLLSVAVGTLKSLGISLAEAKKRVILMAHTKDIPVDIFREGWLSIDHLRPRYDLDIPERFDGLASDETAVIYFSSGNAGFSVVSFTSQQLAIFPRNDRTQQSSRFIPYGHQCHFGRGSQLMEVL